METIILRPKEKCTATIIFMHGLGDTGHGWEDVMKDFQKAYPYIKNDPSNCSYSEIDNEKWVLDDCLVRQRWIQNRTRRIPCN